MLLNSRFAPEIKVFDRYIDGINVVCKYKMGAHCKA